ncbi:MAG: N-acetylmuramoyl-L-alanine amidase family protein [Defluviitaleaceae bacterium]|nr:N-acetylmuramoyl-L-alanine amidase family protein [Defluviitaleaceae bacterium]
MKKIASFFICASIIFGSCFFCDQKAFAGSVISLYINNARIENPNVPPVIRESRTLVPARDVFEQIGAVVGWDGDTARVFIDYKNTSIILQINSAVALVNGEERIMDVPPLIINDRTMIPLRFPAEALGFIVDWDPDEPAVYISEPKLNISDHEIIPLPPETIVSVPHEETRIISVTPHDGGMYRIQADSEITGVFHFLLPDNRLVIDIENSKNFLDPPFALHPDLPVLAVRASQFTFEPPVTRVVFEIKSGAEYSVALSADRKILTVNFNPGIIPVEPMDEPDIPQDEPDGEPKISPVPTTEPVQEPLLTEPDEDEPDGKETAADGRLAVTFDRPARAIKIPKHPDHPFSVDDIHHNDMYNNLQYVLTLPLSLSEYVTYGEIPVRDLNLKGAFVSENTSGLTRITINSARVMAFELYEDDLSVYIRAVVPREKYAKIVVIDPGHGGADPGSIARGLIEKNLNLAVSQKLMQLLDADPNIKAYATRSTDVAVGRPQRSEFANSVGDLFISIHHNSVERNTATIRGIETFYYDTETVAFTGKMLAEQLQKRLLDELKANDRRIASVPYDVLKDTHIPAALCEIGFMSHPEESLLLTDEDYQWRAALAIYRGILDAFNAYTPKR